MKKLVTFLLAILMLMSLAPCVSAASKASAQTINFDTPIQAEYTKIGQDVWYKFVATEDQYYEIKIRNQSVETRTNIVADSWLDFSLLFNAFNGNLKVVIEDSYGDRLAKESVKCGYEGSIYLHLNKGETYYIGLGAEYAGNYRISVSKLNDIGGQSASEATEITSTAQVISKVDVSSDVDWFVFKTDDYHSFYEFSVENVSCSSNLYFYLYEDAGEAGLRYLMDFSVGTTNTVTKNIELNNNGKYYYRISSSGGTGGYIVNAKQHYDAVSSNKADAYPIDRDATITSSFDGNNDVDYYKFTTADYDAYYHFYFENLSGVYNYFRVYDEAGNEILTNGYYGNYNNFSGNAKLEKNTTYYVYVKGDSRGNYNLSITTVADPDGNNKNNATAINLNTKYEKDIAASGDTDWFVITVDDYTDCRIRLISESGGNKYVKLFNSRDTEYFCIGGTTEKTITLESGTYYLEVDNSAGNYTLVVADCGKSHDWKIKRVINEATCNSEGQVLYYCTCCYTEKTEKVEKDLSNHIGDTVIKDATAATCTEKGYTGDTYCISCNTKLSGGSSIAATGHTKATVKGYAATCTKTGLTDGVKCSVCGEILTAQQTIKATGHTKATVKGYAATCTKAGLTDGVKCSVCNEILKAQRTINAKGHTKTTIKGYAATCTKAGLTDGVKCSVCNVTLTAQKEIPMLSHTFGAWAVVKVPTASAEGREERACSFCGKKETRAIAKFNFILGDVNGDNQITAEDARLALRLSAGLETLEKLKVSVDVVDYNGDKQITAEDARRILRKSAGLE